MASSIECVAPVSGYDRLVYAPLHTLRHIKQIAEVKGTAGYPHGLPLLPAVVPVQ